MKRIAFLAAIAVLAGAADAAWAQSTAPFPQAAARSLGDSADPPWAGTGAASIASVLKGLYQKAGAVAAVTAVDRSLSLTASAAGQFAAANAARHTFSLQVPACLASGIYISWSGTAGNGTPGSYLIPTGTLFFSLDVSVIGLGAITYYAPAVSGTCIVPATEG